MASNLENKTPLLTAALPLALARPPLGCSTTQKGSGPLLGPLRSQRDKDSSHSEAEPDVEGVMLVLNQALDACRPTVKVSLNPSNILFFFF